MVQHQLYISTSTSSCPIQLSDALDGLLEKRASVRMSALEQLNNLMTFQYVGGVIEDKYVITYIPCLQVYAYE